MAKMFTKNTFPIMLIGTGIILLLPMLTGGEGNGLFSQKNRITCEVTIHDTGLFSFAEIKNFQCARDKSIICGISKESPLGAEGTVRVTTSSGNQATESFDISAPTRDAKLILNICSEDTSGEIQLFDKDGKLRDKEIFNVA